MNIVTVELNGTVHEVDMHDIASQGVVGALRDLVMARKCLANAEAGTMDGRSLRRTGGIDGLRRAVKGAEIHVTSLYAA